MIDRIHWKAGDWVLVIGKGFRPIETINEDSLVCTIDGKKRLLEDHQVSFKAVAESVDWKVGDDVYLDGKHKTQIGYIQRHALGFVEYIEPVAQRMLIDGDTLTAAPLDPDLIHKAKLRDIRLEYEEFQTRLAEVMSEAPAGVRRWASDVQEMFDNEFEEQLRGERDE